MNLENTMKALDHVKYVADKECGKSPQVLLINLDRLSKKSKFVKDNLDPIMTLHGVLPIRSWIISKGYDLANFFNTPDGNNYYVDYDVTQILDDLHQILSHCSEDTAYIAYGDNHKHVFKVSWKKACTIWNTLYTEAFFQSNKKIQVKSKASRQDN